MCVIINAEAKGKYARNFRKFSRENIVKSKKKKKTAANLNCAIYKSRLTLNYLRWAFLQDDLP